MISSDCNFVNNLPTADPATVVWNQLTRYQHATDLLPNRSSQQQSIDGRTKELVPGDGSKAFEAANLVQTDGQIVFDEKVNEARVDAIVKRMMTVSGTAVAVLVVLTT